MPHSSNDLATWNASLIRAMPCAFVVVDSCERIVRWNPAAEGLLGYPEAEALGKTWQDLVFLKESSVGDVATLRHRQGHAVHVSERPAPALAPGGGRAFFLEQVPSLLDATQHVIRDVLQMLPAYFSIVDPDLRYRLVCRGCELLFGQPRAAIEGQRVRDMFGPETYAQVEPLLERARSGEPANGEFRALGADGRMHHLVVHFQPLRFGADALEGIFAFAYDVSDLRQAEATLRNSEAQLKALIHHNPDLIVLVDDNLKICFINHTEPDPDTPPEALLNVDVIEIIHPDYRDFVRKQYETVARTGQPVDFEAPIVWKGQLRWFSSRLVAFPHSDQQTAKFLVVSRETTERVKMEHALRESEAHFRLFAEALKDVVYIHEAGPEKVVFVNESFERIWGMPRQQLYDDPQAWLSAIHPDDRESAARAFGAALEGITLNFDAEYRIIRSDGSQRWIHDHGVVVLDDRGRIVRISGMARDVTTRRQAEEERQMFQRQLLETQKLESLGVLAGGIAHDFNNLLAGILANVNLAQLADVDTELGVHLEQIETISLRAADLCKQMLAYAGKGRFVIGHFDLNSLIDEISHLLQISISKKVALRFDRNADLPALRGDASQLRQVLLNLVINASEAFGDRVGQIRIATGIASFSSEDLASFQRGADLAPGSYLYFEVIDDGPGMELHVAERIFEPFFTTKFTGRGLGLAAVQGIVRGHGGAIRVTTTPGLGTTFTVLLPPAADEPIPSPDVLAVIAPLHGQGEVLIVDDESIVRETLSMMLESFGFTPVTACDGREAIDIFTRRHEQLKLVLLDLTMPVLSGEEAHAGLMRINPSVPVIFISGFAEHEFGHDSHARSCAGFLQKPFRLEALEHLIATVLHGDRATLA